MTRTLPTDKRGNIYYGAATAKEAIACADDMSARETLAYVAKLREHGYPGIANRVLAHFGGRKELERLAGDKTYDIVTDSGMQTIEAPNLAEALKEWGDAPASITTAKAWEKWLDKLGGFGHIKENGVFIAYVQA